MNPNLKKIGNASCRDWHWGPLRFDGLLGLHGIYLCFHRYHKEGDSEATVDPAKPVFLLEAEAGGSSIPHSEPGGVE